MTTTKVFIIIFTFLISFAAAADWKLDAANSSIEFVSIKNNLIAETHSFNKISGSITSDGLVSVSVNLDSVNTLIPIRDDRMRNLLFKTTLFPKAEFAAQISAHDLNLASESFQLREVEGSLRLHGEEVALKVDLVSFRENQSLRVITNSPILISSEDFKLSTGIMALRDIAGLDGISFVVPVTLDLLFVDIGEE